MSATLTLFKALRGPTPLDVHLFPENRRVVGIADTDAQWGLCVLVQPLSSTFYATEEGRQDMRAFCRVP